MVGPEAFTEVRYLMAPEQLQGAREIPLIADDFETVFGRTLGGLRPRVPDRGRRHRRRHARLGPGPLEDVVDELRDEGVRSASSASRASARGRRRGRGGARAALDRVVVLERAFAVGAGGIVGQDVRADARRTDDPRRTTSSPGSAAVR